MHTHGKVHWSLTRVFVATLILFSLAHVKLYRTHFMTFPLSCTRISRADPFITQYIHDLALSDNSDAVGHVIGQASEVYATTVSKLSIVLYHYLYFRWSDKEIELVLGS